MDQKDPKPKEKTTPGREVASKVSGHGFVTIGVFQKLESKVDRLVTQVDWIVDLLDASLTTGADTSTACSQLETKLKETIRAVERLAKGKSLGCLGLPPEESWDNPKQST